MAILDTEFNSFINKSTNFATWQDMLNAAVKGVDDQTTWS